MPVLQRPVELTTQSGHSVDVIVSLLNYTQLHSEAFILIWEI
jgi:hypothetical protein